MHKVTAAEIQSLLTFQFLVGAAHGLSSILQMLLSCKEFMKSDPDAERDIRASVDFMLSLMQPNGNIAPAMDEVGPRAHHRPASEELVHWCHGAPGNSLFTDARVDTEISCICSATCL